VFTKNLEVHVEPGGLQITRTSEVPHFSKMSFDALPFFFAGDVAS